MSTTNHEGKTTVPQLTLDQLKTIMRECAGEDESVNLDGDILDVPFPDLGYDSLALLETASRVQRQFDVQLSDEDLTEVETPKAFLDLVNTALGQTAETVG